MSGAIVEVLLAPLAFSVAFLLYSSARLTTFRIVVHVADRPLSDCKSKDCSDDAREEDEDEEEMVSFPCPCFLTCVDKIPFFFLSISALIVVVVVSLLVVIHSLPTFSA